MIDIKVYLPKLIELLLHHFESRLLYVGLQGSYLRGDATATSDIDIMVVIDELNVQDLDYYRNIIHSMEYADKSCGFICSRTDLAHWNPLEIAHLLHTTKDYYGTLMDLVPSYTTQDLQNFIKLSLNNLYHEICHRYIHSKTPKDPDRLRGSYKSVFFILQNLHYLKTGNFPATKADLLQVLDGNDQHVLARALTLESGNSFDFDGSFSLLFAWCQETLSKL